MGRDCASERVPIALAEADQRPPGRGRCGGRAGGCRKNAVLRVRVRRGFPGRGVEIGRSLCASARIAGAL